MIIIEPTNPQDPADSQQFGGQTGQVPGAPQGGSPLEEVSQPQTPVAPPVDTPAAPPAGETPAVETPSAGSHQFGGQAGQVPSEAPEVGNPPAGGASAPSTDPGQVPTETESNPTGGTSGQ